MNMDVDIVQLKGGIDQVTPPVAAKPGELLTASNFEPDINGGYRTIAGVERFDGKPSPSAMRYAVVTVALTGSLAVGDTITGDTSAATAVVLQVNSPTEVVTTEPVGTFIDGEQIEVASVSQGTIDAVPEFGASTEKQHAEYLALAADYQRAFIDKPPGEGPIRGVWAYRDDIYAFRDNVGATRCDMWKATSTGWVPVVMGREIQFENAVGEIFQGDTITGGTSGATGVVLRALLRTGTWTTAGVGTLVFATVTGTFQDGEALQVSAVTKADADGADTAISLLPGGRFTFDNYNFTANADDLRMYFADGVNEVHEFDGTTVVPIRTDSGASKPKFVVGHQRHLFVSVEGSLMLSSVGNPYAWTALTGAAELGLGDVCTGLLRETGDAGGGVLYVTTERTVQILHGTSAANFRLIVHSSNTGGRPYTLQHLGLAYMLNATGVTTVQSSDRFGGFEFTTSTRRVQRFMDSLRNKETASLVLWSRNQYRLFFGTGDVLVLHLVPSGNGFTTEALFIDYGADIAAFTAFSFVMSDGVERSFLGGTDGMVYELDRGTSLDGQPLLCHLVTRFNTQKKLRTRKRYRRLVLQLETGGYTEARVGYDLSFGRLDASPPDFADFVLAQGPGGVWDRFTWDSFTWDGEGQQELNVDTPGVGTSLSLSVLTNSAIQPPFLLHTAIMYSLPGTIQR